MMNALQHSFNRRITHHGVTSTLYTVSESTRAGESYRLPWSTFLGCSVIDLPELRWFCGMVTVEQDGIEIRWKDVLME